MRLRQLDVAIGASRSETVDIVLISQSFSEIRLWSIGRQVIDVVNGNECNPILVDETGKVAIVTLNRPAAMNAFTTAMGEMFNTEMRRLSHSRDVRVIVITGAGERGFCTGADLKERNGMTSEQWQSQHRIFEEKMELVRDCPKPVIGAINGVAVGGGLEIAMQMDFAIASTAARFGQLEVKRGIIPGGGGTQWLPRRIPLGVAMQLLLTGDIISAEEAFRIGLVNELVEPEALLPRTLQIASTIASNSPAAIRQIRTSVRLGYAAPIDTALGIELQCYSKMVDHPDRREGVAAFAEKRSPTFLDPSYTSVHEQGDR